MTPIAPIVPTVGRVVLYTPAALQNIDPDCVPWPVLIARVHNDRLINIGGFDFLGRPVGAQMVTLLQPGDKVPVEGHYCQWMDYQLRQASNQAIGIESVQRVFIEEAQRAAEYDKTMNAEARAMRPYDASPSSSEPNQ